MARIGMNTIGVNLDAAEDVKRFDLDTKVLGDDGYDYIYIQASGGALASGATPVDSASAALTGYAVTHAVAADWYAWAKSSTR